LPEIRERKSGAKPKNKNKTRKGNMQLTQRTSNYVPHPEGVYPAVCVDVMDLGPTQVEFQGRVRMVNKVRVVFETEQVGQDGRHLTTSKTFTASVHPKAALAEFIAQWRGRPVVPGETIDLDKMVGASCTLVIGHQVSPTDGQTFASITAAAKPTKQLKASGDYKPAEARQRWEARKAQMEQNKQAGGVQPTGAGCGAGGGQARPLNGAPGAAAKAAQAPGYDPEVGF
jgi:hypothetical protein